MSDMWLQEYRVEIDRQRRRSLFDQASEQEGTPAYDVRKALYLARYDEKEGAPVDHFIRGWLMYGALYRRFYLPGEKKRLQKEIEEIKNVWQFPLAEQYGNEGAEALEDELFNLTLLYMDICERDKIYNSVLLGLGHIDHDRRVGKIAHEIRQMIYAIPDKVKFTSEMDVFCRAAKEAFCYKFPSSKELVERKE